MDVSASAELLCFGLMALVPPDETEKPLYFPILAAEEKWNVCGPRGPGSEGAAATKRGGLGGKSNFCAPFAY